MKIKHLITYLETIAPPRYQESYDNAGLIVGHPDTEITGVLVCLDSDRHMTKQTLSALEKELSNRGFLRVHRSFLVRMAAVTAHTTSEIEVGGASIPVGRSYKESVLGALNG